MCVTYFQTKDSLLSENKLFIVVKVNNSPFVGKMNRAKRQKKIPKHFNEYVLRTKEHSKHSDQAESNMEYSDEGDDNITFIPPKPKKAKLNKVVNPMDPNEVLNPGALVDRGTPNEGVGNPETISSGMHQF